MRGDAGTLGDITARITRLTVRARDAVDKSIFSKQEEAKARQAMTTRMPAAPQHKGPSPITKALPPPGSTIAAYRSGGAKTDAHRNADPCRATCRGTVRCSRR